MGYIIGNTGDMYKHSRALRIAVCARRLALKLNREEQFVGRETPRARILRAQFARIVALAHAIGVYSGVS